MEKIEFESWWDIFVDTLRQHHKYNGPIDRDSAYEDYDNDMEPETAADELFSELNRQD